MENHRPGSVSFVRKWWIALREPTFWNKFARGRAPLGSKNCEGTLQDLGKRIHELPKTNQLSSVFQLIAEFRVMSMPTDWPEKEEKWNRDRHSFLTERQKLSCTHQANKEVWKHEWKHESTHCYISNFDSDAVYLSRKYLSTNSIFVFFTIF